MLAPSAVLLDIEGTTTPPSFIQGRLLPFAHKALPDWAGRIDLPDVATILAEIRCSTGPTAISSSRRCSACRA